MVARAWDPNIRLRETRGRSTAALVVWRAVNEGPHGRPFLGRARGSFRQGCVSKESPVVGTVRSVFACAITDGLALFHDAKRPKQIAERRSRSLTALVEAPSCVGSCASQSPLGTPHGSSVRQFEGRLRQLDCRGVSEPMCCTHSLIVRLRSGRGHRSAISFSSSTCQSLISAVVAAAGQPPVRQHQQRLNRAAVPQKLGRAPLRLGAKACSAMNYSTKSFCTYSP